MSAPLVLPLHVSPLPVGVRVSDSSGAHVYDDEKGDAASVAEFVRWVAETVAESE